MVDDIFFIFPDPEQVMCKINFPIPNRSLILNRSHARFISWSQTGHMQVHFLIQNRSCARSISWSRTGHMKMSFLDPEQVTCMCHFLIPNRSHARSISWSRTSHVQGPILDPEQVTCECHFLIPNKVHFLTPNRSHASLFPDLNRSCARSYSWSRSGHMQVHFLIQNRSHARSISWPRTGHVQGLFPDPGARYIFWSLTSHLQVWFPDPEQVKFPVLEQISGVSQPTGKTRLLCVEHPCLCSIVNEIS